MFICRSCGFKSNHVNATIVAKVKLSGRMYDNTRETELLKEAMKRKSRTAGISMTYPTLIDVDYKGAERLEQACPNCGSSKVEEVIFCAICGLEGAEVWIDGIGFTHKECLSKLKKEFPSIESNNFSQIDERIAHFRNNLENSRNNPGGEEWLRRG